jgi:hypothetical protein
MITSHEISNIKYTPLIENALLKKIEIYSNIPLHRECPYCSYLEVCCCNGDYALLAACVVIYGCVCLIGV